MISLVEGKGQVQNTPGMPARNESGAPAPTRQGLDDLHPQFAGDHHDSISSPGR